MPRHSLRWFSLVLIILMAGGLTWYKMRPKEIDVTVAQVTRGTVEKVVANTRAGTLNACRKANLSPGTGGQISILTVDEGDSVKKGQLLLELWNADLKAEAALAASEIKAAESKASVALLQAEIASRDAERMRQLIRDNAISEQDADKTLTEAKVKQAGYEAAVTEVKAVQSRLDVVRAQLDRTRLTAPFDGIIAKVNGELSEYVTPSPPGIPTPPVIELLDTSCFYVTAPIDEVDAPAVRINMAARVIMDAFGDRHFSARVRRIDPYVLDIEKQARTVDVEVEFIDTEDTKDFLAGYSADVEIIIEVKHDTLRIPTQAVLDSNRVYVYQQQNRRLQEKTIRMGLTNWDNTEVLEGLQQDEYVVVSTDRQGLQDGVLARISTQK
jgi:HlyD family secretion protein